MGTSPALLMAALVLGAAVISEPHISFLAIEGISLYPESVGIVFDPVYHIYPIG
jgi:hypothetical protein